MIGRTESKSGDRQDVPSFLCDYRERWFRGLGRTGGFVAWAEAMPFPFDHGRPVISKKTAPIRLLESAIGNLCQSRYDGSKSYSS